MIELTLYDLGELAIVGSVASAINFAIVEHLKRLVGLSRLARRLAPTVVGVVSSVVGFPMALAMFTPVTFAELRAWPLWAGVLVVSFGLAIVQAAGASWAFTMWKAAAERIGERLPDILIPK